MSKKDIIGKIEELQELLKKVQDIEKRKDLEDQIKDLEEKLDVPIWKKVAKYITIISAIAGTIYTILQIVLIFM